MKLKLNSSKKIWFCLPPSGEQTSTIAEKLLVFVSIEYRNLTSRWALLGCVSVLQYEEFLLPFVSPRWCTGNKDSAVWLVESRAQCRCPVAMDSSATTAPPPQSARCAPNRPWSSSSPDLTTPLGPPQIPDQSVLIPQTPAFGLNSFSKLHPDNVSTDLVFYFQDDVYWWMNWPVL